VGGRSAADAARLVAALPAGAGLESLAWLAPPDHPGLEAALARRGPTLRRFEAYHAEAPTSADALSLAQVRALAAHAPGARHVALVLDRGGDGAWPWEHLAALARAAPRAQDPALSVHVWLELTTDCTRGASSFDHGCAEDDLYRLPRLTAATAQEVADFMARERAGAAAAPLQNLTFFAGDWGRPWDGPIYDPPWVEGRREKVVCRRAADAEAGGAGVVAGDGSGDGQQLVCEMVTDHRELYPDGYHPYNDDDDPDYPLFDEYAATAEADFRRPDRPQVEL
jgi:hypothetical protein